MQSSFQRRLWVLLIAGSMAFACWKWFSGTIADEWVFATASKAHYNPPFIVEGAGTHAKPWTLRTFSKSPHPGQESAPGIVALQDDPSGFFQESPHSPLDIAVILTNLRRLGARDAAASTVFSWDAPDPMGLAALDKAIGDFRSMVMCAPLSRAAVPQAIPEAFRRTSIPISQIDGNSNQLPVVNRIPLPGIILGGENCTAGFQSLDSEGGNPGEHLLAVWEDRVVFSFSLALSVRNLGVPLDQVIVRPGDHIRIGAKGPVIPIDLHGRLNRITGSVTAPLQITAADLIDAKSDAIPEPLRNRMILRDDRSGSAPATRAASGALASLVAAMSSESGFSEVTGFQRPATRTEWTMLAVLLGVLALVSKLEPFPRNVLFLTIGSLCVAAQLVALGSGHWLPGVPAVAALASAWLVARVVPLREKRPKPEKPEKQPKTEKPVKVAKAEKPAKVAKAEKPVKVAKVEKPAKVAKVEKPTKVAKVEKPAKVAKVEKPAKVAKVEKPAKVAKVEKPAKVAKVEKPAKVAKVEKPEKVAKVEKPAKVAKAEKPAKVAKAEKTARVTKARKAAKSGESTKSATAPKVVEGSVVGKMPTLPEKTPKEVTKRAKRKPRSS